jgi:choice-of-anchor B domain-containing protein
VKRLALCAALVVGFVGQSHAQASPGVRLLGQLPLTSFAGPPSIGSAIISYTSPGGREYAIIGMSNGKHFVDVTDPTNPTVVGFVATPSSSAWQEMCVKNGYCYGVSEHNKLAIIDIRDIDNGNINYVGEWSTTITGVDGITQYTYGRSHTAQASKINDVIFLNGSSGFDRRYFIALNVSNPEIPVIQSYIRHYDPALNIGGDVLYVHDCTIVTYDSGPYAGKEIAFLCCGPDGLWTADVTDPNNMVLLGHNQYLPTGTYCHSGSLSADKKYFYVNDEFDEAQGAVTSNSTHIINVEDLSNPVFVRTDQHGLNIIDHNSTVENGHLLVSSYRGGLRVFKFETPTELTEIGHYDTYPAADAADYEGNWGVDGGFPSGNLILSDRQTGLYVVDPTELLGLGLSPTTQTATNGAFIGGSMYQTRRSDDNHLRFSGTEFELKFQSTMTAKPLLDLTLEASGEIDRTQLFLYIKNQTSGQWRLLTRTLLNPTDQTLTFPDLDAATYMNGSKEVELRFKVSPGRPTFPSGGRLRIDAVNIVLK